MNPRYTILDRRAFVAGATGAIFPGRSRDRTGTPVPQGYTDMYSQQHTRRRVVLCALGGTGSLTLAGCPDLDSGSDNDTDRETGGVGGGNDDGRLGPGG